jgi:uncharacterized protein YigE (DUF2233 family)
MKQIAAYLSITLFLFLGASAFTLKAFNEPTPEPVSILSHIVDPKTEQIQMFLKDKNGKHYQNIGKLKTALKGQGRTLTFAMNGGMYMEDLNPLGLFVEGGKTIRNVNSVQEAHGNFYMQPNGVFAVYENGKALVVQTPDFTLTNEVQYATQSGPMLLINGKIHSAFNEGSENVNIRNGAGILPDGRVLFAMSKGLINFYDFASFFKEQGCSNALYLDGFVSKAYMPNQGWEQLNGKLGVLIGVVE